MDGEERLVAHLSCLRSLAFAVPHPWRSAFEVSAQSAPNIGHAIRAALELALKFFLVVREGQRDVVASLFAFDGVTEFLSEAAVQWIILMVLASWVVRG